MNVSLWRALHSDVGTANPLYPDFESREVRGVLRTPDVQVKDDLVVARLGQGTSLFDRPYVFGQKGWQCFEIPKGTLIPDGLIITKDQYSEKYRATHYTISPNYTMTKEKFIWLLGQLARNARAMQKKSQKNG